MNKLILSVILVSAIPSVRAQTTEPIILAGVEKVNEGFRSWDLTTLQEGNALLERAMITDPDNLTASYWHAFGYYRLAIRTLYGNDEKKEKLAEGYIEKGIRILETAVDKDPRASDHLALLATLTGMSIQFNPLTGMWKGPKSNGYFEDAATANPANPRVMFLWGIAKMNTPSMFGGGAEKALTYFETAVKLYEKEKERPATSSLQPRWGYDECCAFYGNALLAVNDRDQARALYEKALSINADQRLAKSGLKKLQDQK